MHGVCSKVQNSFNPYFHQSDFFIFCMVFELWKIIKTWKIMPQIFFGFPTIIQKPKEKNHQGLEKNANIRISQKRWAVEPSALFPSALLFQNERWAIEPPSFFFFGERKKLFFLNSCYQYFHSFHNSFKCSFQNNQIFSFSVTIIWRRIFCGENITEIKKQIIQN